MRKHLLCTLLNASSLINGIAFAESEDPAGMLSVDPIDETDEVAAALLTIPGYEVVEVADKGGKATGPTQAELDAEAARKAAEREAAEKEAAEAAAAEQAEKDAAAAAEAEAAAKAEQEAKDAEAAAAAQKEADELAALEAEIAAEEAAKAEGGQADPPAETTAAPKASGGKSKGSK